MRLVFRIFCCIVILMTAYLAIDSFFEKPSLYVRVCKEDGKYWFEQNGERFLALAVNEVLPRAWTDPVKGPKYDVLSEYDNDLGKWSKAASDRLKKWRFNTVGAFSYSCLYDNVPMYHARVIWFRRESGKDPDLRLVDVFSDEFAETVDKDAREGTANSITNQYLIGYFINNELPWYGEHGWPTASDVSLLSRYMELPATSPGKKRAVEFLKKFYSNDFSAFEVDWKSGVEDFSKLKTVAGIAPASARAPKIEFAWAGVVAEKYYNLCSEAIRRYDPNHLVLGSRFADMAPVSVMAACGKYSDVISINQYRKTGDFDEERAGAIAMLIGKPVMITEFSWRAEENKSGCRNTGGADVTVATQNDRADAFRSYVTEALEQPYIVGYNWFTYADQPAFGRADGENSNYGLVSISDEPYEELLATITEINSRAHEIHYNSTVQMPEYNEVYIADYREPSVRECGTGLGKPIEFANAESKPTWCGANGTRIDIKPASKDMVVFAVTLPENVWGAALEFSSPDEIRNPDASGNILGASNIVVTARGPMGARFSIALNESGHGSAGKQTYDGFGNADGEAYTSFGVRCNGEWQDYVFELADMHLNGSHGNQRGNCIIDTDAVALIDIIFPGKQKSYDLEFREIRVE